MIRSQLGKYCIVPADTPADGMVNLGVLLKIRNRIPCDCASGAIWNRWLTTRKTGGAGGAGRRSGSKRRSEMGAEKMFDYLESNVSGAIRVTDREEVKGGGLPARAGPVVFEERSKQSAGVSNAFTALLAAGGGGKVSREPGNSEDGWMEAPEDLRLATDMFVAPDCRAVDGTEHSRRIAVRLPAWRQGIAARAAGAGGESGDRRRTIVTR